MWWSLTDRGACALAYYGAADFRAWARTRGYTVKHDEYDLPCPLSRLESLETPIAKPPGLQVEVFDVGGTRHDAGLVVAVQ